MLRLECAEDAGYLIAYALAEDNLANGQIPLMSGPEFGAGSNGIELTGRAWHEVAERTGARLVDIELSCSDTAEHRRRVEHRRPEREGQTLPTWDDVIGRAFEPWFGTG